MSRPSLCTLAACIVPTTSLSFVSPFAAHHQICPFTADTDALKHFLFLSALQDVSATIKQSPGSSSDQLLSVLTSDLTERGNNTAANPGTANDDPHLNGHLAGSSAHLNGHSHHYHSSENTNTNGNTSSLATLIKMEPVDTPPCLKSPPSAVPAAAATGISGRHKSPPKLLPLPNGSSSNGTDTPGLPKKKRRLSLKGSDILTPSSLKGRSFTGSCSDDLENDLKLSADDVISGVISTPLIKPLEEEESMITTPSPPLSASAPKNEPPSSSSTPSSSSSSYPSGSTCNNSFQDTGTARVAPVTTSSTGLPANYSLKQDLDEFTKVMAQVTKEEIAKERRKSYSSTQLLSDDPYRASQPPDMTAQAHLVSPPPYHTTATTARPQQPMVSQPPGHYFPATSHPSQHSIPMPRHSSDMSSFSVPPYHIPSATHQYPQLPHMLSQVEPSSATTLSTTFPPQLLQRRSANHIQKHPQLQHLSATSPQVQHPHPVVMSSTVHTPISTQHIPMFPDPSSHSITTPTGTLHVPRTPTTPLEHFASFPPPHHTQIDDHHSSTHPHLSFQSGVGSLPSMYPYRQKMATDHPHTVVRSPTITTAGNVWGTTGGSTLKEPFLAQVNSNLEAMRGQKRPNQDTSGLGFPPAKVSHSIIHNAAPPPNFQQQQYHQSSSYTGGTFPHTISYQGHPTSFPHAPL